MEGQTSSLLFSGTSQNAVCIRDALQPQAWGGVFPNRSTAPSSAKGTFDSISDLPKHHLWGIRNPANDSMEFVEIV
jgi:hypothetical protein